MPLSRRRFLKKSAAAAAGLALGPLAARAAGPPVKPSARGPLGTPATRPIAPGPFGPSWESLQQYQCPDWFRDAKFGIWAHWTAQCVPEQGDWYARQMYMQGSPDYNYQVAHYGHPSQVGFKDIDHLWKADNWNPEELMGLYKAAGAKYFVALANHHDNFDCYDSIYQLWNSVRVGPKKDIVGTWEKIARRHGLRFGVTNHSSQAWHWLQVAYAHDTEGPKAGVPYDGHLTEADGQGTWWEGLDPQDLYTGRHVEIPADITTPRALNAFMDRFNGQNWSQPPPDDPAYTTKWFNRCKELIDKYNPDLLYFDDSLVPLGEAGLHIYAHLYNANMARHGGKLEAVLNVKGVPPDKQKCVVHDFERGRSDKVEPSPWQTDTCIGDWHYRRSLYENHQYKTADQVVKMLVDIVSKNGNLLLNIPLRGDGSIDPDERQFLTQMAAWMKVNSEAIYGTRPWKIAGEGPVKVRGGGFSEGGEERLTAEDFRFTTKKNTLYATAMGWPEGGKYVVKTLAAGLPGIRGSVKRVSLLGSPQKLVWARTADGLEVTLPPQKPGEHAWVLKIEGLDLAASQPVAPAPPPVHADADGVFTLTPDAATLHGGVQAQNGPLRNIGFWDNPQDTVSWTVHFDAPGAYAVSAQTSAANGDTALVLDAGPGARVALAVPKTNGWDDYQIVTGGTLHIAAPGDHVLTARPADPSTWRAMNLATVTLRRTGEG